jgi:hypothetical protein
VINRAESNGPWLKNISVFLIRIKAESVSDGVENSLETKGRQVGGLFHFKPSVQGPLLALRGQIDRTRLCPLLE